VHCPHATWRELRDPADASGAAKRWFRGRVGDGNLGTLGVRSYMFSADRTDQLVATLLLFWGVNRVTRPLFSQK
jgi:hypothetical protein